MYRHSEQEIERRRREKEKGRKGSAMHLRYLLREFCGGLTQAFLQLCSLLISSSEGEFQLLHMFLKLQWEVSSCLSLSL